MLNLLLGHHLKAHEIGDAEGGRHVRGVAAGPHDNAADVAIVVVYTIRGFLPQRPA